MEDLHQKLFITVFLEEVYLPLIVWSQVKIGNNDPTPAEPVLSPTDTAYLWKDLKVQTGDPHDFWGIT